VQLVSKISDLCDPDPPTSQTDGQTTCNLNTALCTSSSRGKQLLWMAYRNLPTLFQIPSPTSYGFPLPGLGFATQPNTAIVITARCYTHYTQSALMRLHVVCPSVRPSVCLSVTFRYRDHIGWNISKIISRPNSLRPMRSLTPNMGDLVQREHPKIRVE